MSLLIFAAAVLLAWFAFRVDAGWYWVLRKRWTLSDRILREDALKYLARCEIENERSSLRGLAGSLGIGGGETSRIVSQLAERGLLTIAGGEFLLTGSGRDYGRRMIRAHRLYETYMSEKTGFGEGEWHERAEWEEHNLSEEDVIALDQALAYPVHDPHGDPIPDRDGGIVQLEDVVHLGELESGQCCRIVHLEDEPAEVYRPIVAAGLYPGLELDVLEGNDLEVRFRADNGEHRLPRLVARNIQVVALERRPAVAATGSMMNLAGCPAGEPCRIRSISPRISGTERRRLMDLGFLPGTRVVKEYAGSSGDPIAFLVRGTLMALRRIQAENISVEPEPAEDATPTAQPAPGGAS